jgi:hypothetical protein
MTIDIFDQNNKLNCSSSNPNFIIIVASLLQSTYICLRLIELNEIRTASWTFSEAYEKYFPAEPSNLDQLKEAKVFVGDFSSAFSEIYFDLLELWKDIQDERIADLTGENIEINPVGLKNILSGAKEKLERILSRISQPE